MLPVQGYCFTAYRILLKQINFITVRFVCLELAVCGRCGLSYVPEVCKACLPTQSHIMTDVTSELWNVCSGLLDCSKVIHLCYGH